MKISPLHHENADQLPPSKKYSDPLEHFGAVCYKSIHLPSEQRPAFIRERRPPEPNQSVIHWAWTSCPLFSRIYSSDWLTEMHLLWKHSLHTGHGKPSVTCSCQGSHFSLLPKLEATATASFGWLSVKILLRSQDYSTQHGISSALCVIVDIFWTSCLLIFLRFLTLTHESCAEILRCGFFCIYLYLCMASYSGKSILMKIYLINNVCLYAHSS